MEESRYVTVERDPKRRGCQVCISDDNDWQGSRHPRCTGQGERVRVEWSNKRGTSQLLDSAQKPYNPIKSLKSCVEEYVVNKALL